MLSKLITALQKAKLDMTAEEIADALWLALQIDSQQEVDIPQTIPSLSSRPPEDPPLDEQTYPTEEKSANLHLPAQGHHDDTTPYITSIPFRSPAASALPNALALARALRPLMRRLPSKTDVVLNEHATIQRIAETQMRLWIPVFDPAPVRWFDIELVVDTGMSMLLWEKTIAELQTLLEHMGAFRNVRTWRLATDKKDHVEICTGSSQEHTHNLKELINPGGYRLIVVASDCISPAWHSGKVQELLNIWGQKNLVTLIHMLPRRLWPQTALEDADITQIYSSQPEASNRKLKIKQASTWFNKDLIGQLLPLPLLTLEASSLSAWAHILTGTQKTWITGALFEQSPTDILLSDKTSSHREEDDTPKKRVQLFRINASSHARKLAGLLAAAPLPISLPVIRQVQSTMVQEANQVHIAEVFLGGLLEEIYRDETHHDPDQIQYDFITGVRDELTKTVPIPDAHRVFREISHFVRDRYGQPRDFLAFIATQQRKSDQNTAITKGSRPFAHLELNTLRRFGGAFIELVDELERQIEHGNEQQIALPGNIDPHQTVLESPQEYATTLTRPVPPNPSYLNEIWCSFTWTTWLPLNSPEISIGSGIYRVRAIGGNEIFFIGSTGRSLRERIGDLYRNIMKDATQMPFNDPHTAAPTLWAWRDDTHIDFECSALALSSQENLEILVHYFLWHYRLERGDSTLANYGRSHPQYTKSSNRSTGRRGHRLPEGSSNPAVGPSLEPLQLEGTPFDTNWMGLEWNEYYSLTNGNFKNIASSPGAYKVIDTDTKELLFIGSTPNLRKRLPDLKLKSWNCPYPAVAFALQSPHLRSYQLAEMESDLLGAYYEQTKKPPKVQFGTPQADTDTITQSERDSIETPQLPRYAIHTVENKSEQILSDEDCFTTIYIESIEEQKYDQPPDYILRWRDYFVQEGHIGGHQLKDPTHWNTILLPQLYKCKDEINRATDCRLIKVRGQARLSCWFAFGYVFSEVASYILEVDQHGQFWRTDTTENKDFSFTITSDQGSPDGETLDDEGDTVALGIGISTHIDQDVRKYLEKSTAKVAALLLLKKEDERQKLQDASEVVAMAKSIKRHARAFVNHRGARKLLIFYAGPASGACFIGHILNATCTEIQIMEYQQSGYAPSFLLK